MDVTQKQVSEELDAILERVCTMAPPLIIFLKRSGLGPKELMGLLGYSSGIMLGAASEARHRGSLRTVHSTFMRLAEATTGRLLEEEKE